MPTGVYVRKNSVIGRLEAGMAADHADGFKQWLRERRYTPLTIIERMRLLASWTQWSRENGYALGTIREAHAASFALIKAGYEHHIKWQPAHRLAIYRRAIDWFSFWLKGEMPSDPAEAARWTALRQEATAPNSAT